MIVHGYLDGDKYFSKSENCSFLHELSMTVHDGYLDV